MDSRQSVFQISRLIRCLVATAMLALVAALLVPLPQSAAAKDDEKTMTVALVDPTVDSLNPFTTIYRTVTSIHRMTYDYLTMYSSKDASPTAGLAESWETSEDGLTWTYKIRDDSTFSDGEPVTADDVVFTYQTIMDDKSGAMANSSYLEDVKSVEAPDEQTVVLKLERPSASMLAIDIPIVPEHIWKDVKDVTKETNEGEYPVVGNGPFVITDYKRTESLTLTANKDYWRGAPGFDKVVFRFYKDQDSAVEALRKGEADLVPDITPLQADALKKESGIKVNVGDGKRFTGFTINPGAEAQNGEPIGDGHPALKDPEVRRAILHVIDREELVDRVHGGYFDPAGSYIPTRYDDYHWEPSEDELIEPDVEEANRILDEAGYKLGSDGIRTMPGGGRKLEIRQDYHGDDPDEKQTAQFIGEWLEEIGIKVTSEPTDDIGGILDSGEFDLLWTGWTVNPDPSYIFSIQTCDVRPAKPGASYQSDAYNCNEEYDKLFAQQRAELDPEKRAEYAKEMQRILYEDGVVVILGYQDMLEAYSTDVIEEGSFDLQPAKTGNIYGQDGYWSFWSAQPAEDSGSGSSNTGLIAGIGAGVLVVAAGVGLLLWRRRSATADDRE